MPPVHQPRGATARERKSREHQASKGARHESDGDVASSEKLEFAREWPQTAGIAGSGADLRISRPTWGHGVADVMEAVLSRVGGREAPALVELAALALTGSLARRAGSARTSLVSTDRALHFELSREKSCAQRGAERLYRTARAWFTPAVFERRVSVERVAPKDSSTSVTARDSLAVCRFGGC